MVLIKLARWREEEDNRKKKSVMNTGGGNWNIFPPTLTSSKFISVDEVLLLEGMTTLKVVIVNSKFVSNQ